MKKFFLLALMSAFLIGCDMTMYDEHTYSGVVVSKSRLDPTSGYKSSTDEVFQIFMKEDRSQKIIKVEVTVPTWHSVEIGNRVSFTLSNLTMYRLGNTLDSDKTLWEQ